MLLFVIALFSITFCRSSYFENVLFLARYFRGLCAHVHNIYKQHHRETALLLAAENGHSESVRLLLEGGSDKDAVNRVRIFMFAVLCVFAFEEFLNYI